MNKSSSSRTSSGAGIKRRDRATRDHDEFAKVTQADLNRATFRVGLKPAPRKQRITILLDTGLVEYFKAKAGERGYQSLINDALRQAKDREGLEETLRRVVREESRRK